MPRETSATTTGGAHQQEPVGSPSLIVDLLDNFQHKLANVFATNLDVGQVEMSKRAKNWVYDDSAPEVLDGRLWSEFPRRCHFYWPHIRIIEVTSRHALDTAVQALLEWMPLHAEWKAGARPDSIPDSDRLFHLVPSFSAKDPKHIDLLDFVTDIIVADSLSCVLRNFDGQNLTQERLSELQHLAFLKIKPQAPRKLRSGLWKTLRSVVVEQWAVVLHRLTPYRLDNIVKQFSTFVVFLHEPPSTEEAVSYFRGIRHLRLSIADKEGVRQVRTFLSLQLQLIEMYNNNDQVRAAQAEVLACALRQLNLTNAGPGTENNVLFQQVESIYNTALKWSKVADLEVVSLALLTTILVRAPNDFYQKNITGHFEKLMKNLKKDKKTSESLACILHILQGAYCPARGWLLEKYDSELANMDDPGANSPWRYFMRGDEPANARLERIKLISGELFKRKVLSRLLEHIEVFVDIVLQMAVQSLDYVSNTTFPTLFAEGQKLPEFYLIGIKALRIILDPNSGFQRQSLLAQPEEERASYQRKLGALGPWLASYIERVVYEIHEQVGDKVMGRAQNSLPVTNYLKPKQDKKAEGGDPVDEVASVRHRRRKSMGEKNLLIDIYTEALRALPMALPAGLMTRKSAQKSVCIISLLSHVQPTLGTAASHTLQLVTAKYQQHRMDIARSFLDFCADPLYQDGPTLTTFANHLNAILQVWKTQLNLEPLEVIDEAHKDLMEGLLLDIEVSALGFLCHPSKNLRVAALSILNTVVDVQEAFDDQLRSLSSFGASDDNRGKRVGSLLTDMEEKFVRSALKRSMLEDVSGIEKDLGLTPKFSIPSLVVIAGLQNSLLWSYCLSEIGWILMDHCNAKLVSSLREHVSGRLKGLARVPAQASLSDLNTRIFNDVYSTLWVNYQVLFFALAGPPESFSGANSSGGALLATDLVLQEHRRIETELEKHINSGFWAYLFSEITWCRDAVVMSIVSVHWRSLASVVRSLETWYVGHTKEKAMAAKKKEKGPRVVGRILRMLSQTPQFRRTVAHDNGIVHTYRKFLAQTEQRLANLSKYDTLEVEDQETFLDYALTIGTLAHTVALTMKTRHSSNIRASSSADGIWRIEERSRTFNVLKTWCYLMDAEDQFDPEELARQQIARLAKTKTAKNLNNRMSTAIQTPEYLKWKDKLQYCARTAVQKLAGMGCLVVPGTIKTEPVLLDWFLALEVNEHKVLGDLLAYNFDELLPLYLTRVYNDPPEEAVHFFHALCDQFKVPDLSRSSGADNTSEPESGLPNKQLGTLLHLGFYHLSNKDKNVRWRAFELTSFCVLRQYGLDAESVSALRKILDHFKGRFQTAIRASAYIDAVRFSESLSVHCPELTLHLFNECFNRMDEIQEDATQEWMLEMALPWCDYVARPARESYIKSGATMLKGNKAASLQSFLSGLFSMCRCLRSGLHRALSLWERIAFGSAHTDEEKANSVANLCITLDFVVTKASADPNDWPLCLAISACLYRYDPAATLNILVPLIHPNGELDAIDEFFQRDADRRVSKASSTGRRITFDATRGFAESGAAPPMLSSSGVPVDAPPMLSSAQPTAGLDVQRKSAHSSQNRSSSVAPSEDGMSQYDPDQPPPPRYQKPTQEYADKSVALAIIFAELARDHYEPFDEYAAILLHYALMNLESQASEGFYELLRVLLKGILENGKNVRVENVEALDEAMELLNTAGFCVKWTSPYARSQSSAKASNIWDILELLTPLVAALTSDSKATIGELSLSWAVKSDNFRLAVKSHVLYRELLNPLEPESIRTLSNCLIEGLVEYEIWGNAGRLYNEECMDAETKAWNYLAELPQSMRVLSLMQCLEITDTLQRIVDHTAQTSQPGDDAALLFMAAALLRVRPPVLYAGGLHMYNTFLSNKERWARLEACVDNNQASSFVPHYQILTLGWNPDFAGMQPSLIQGLFAADTEALARDLIVKNSYVPHNDFIDKSGGRDLRSVLMLMPWLVVSLPGRRLEKPDETCITARSTCTRLADAIANRVPSVADILRIYAEGTYDDEPDLFITKMCEKLTDSFLPEHTIICGDVLTLLLMRGRPKWKPSIFKITREFICFNRTFEWLGVIEEIVKLATSMVSNELNYVCSELVAEAIGLRKLGGNKAFDLSLSDDVMQELCNELPATRNCYTSLQVLRQIAMSPDLSAKPAGNLFMVNMSSLSDIQKAVSTKSYPTPADPASVKVGLPPKRGTRKSIVTLSTPYDDVRSRTESDLAEQSIMELPETVAELPQEFESMTIENQEPVTPDVPEVSTPVTRDELPPTHRMSVDSASIMADMVAPLPSALPKMDVEPPVSAGQKNLDDIRRGSLDVFFKPEQEEIQVTYDNSGDANMTEQIREQLIAPLPDELDSIEIPSDAPPMPPPPLSAGMAAAPEPAEDAVGALPSENPAAKYGGFNMMAGGPPPMLSAQQPPMLSAQPMEKTALQMARRESAAAMEARAAAAAAAADEGHTHAETLPRPPSVGVPREGTPDLALHERKARMMNKLAANMPIPGMGRPMGFVSVAPAETAPQEESD